MKKIYLDYAATTPVKVEVVNAMIPYFTKIEDFSEDLNTFRSRFETLIGADKDTVTFNSGGSFGNNEAIRTLAYRNRSKGNHIMASRIEHPSVYKVFEQLSNEGFEVSFVKVKSDGIIDMDDFDSKLRPDTCLVSVMLVNNEIGTSQPIDLIQTKCKKNQTFLHVDAVQALGNFEINVKKLGIDAMTFSSHKVYAPKGCGALYIRNEIDLIPLLSDCKTSKYAKSTNIPYIAGFLKGVELAYESLEVVNQRKKMLKRQLISGINALDLGIEVNGDPENPYSHPGIVNMYYPQMDGDSLVINYDFAGIAISSGSACSSGALSASHVLKAIGRSEIEAKKCIRITIGDFTTMEDIETFIDVTSRILKGTKDVR